jgi:hypothetical protein
MRQRHKPDSELKSIRRIMAILLEMPSAQRLRVLYYVKDRVELLPVGLPDRPAKQPEADLLIPPAPK